MHRDAKKGRTVRIATEPKLHFSLRNSWGVKRLKRFIGGAVDKASKE